MTQSTQLNARGVFVRNKKAEKRSGEDKVHGFLIAVEDC
jgi:hypothetical protein